MKVPALSFVLAFALVACGGDAESAADSDSEPVRTGAEVGEDVVTPPPPGSQTPPPGGSQTPPPSGARTPPPPPVQDTPDPVVEPPTEEVPPVSDPSEGDWEELETPMNILPVGTVILARVVEPVSTRTHETGDAFRAEVSEELLGSDGRVLVPAGAELRGRVTSARASSDSDEESVLVLAIDALVIDGEELPLQATVLEADVTGDAGASGARSVGTVATGAAAGAILGQILGRDTRSTVAGAAVGAVAGAGVALSTRDGHARVPEGATLTLQLDEPLVVTVLR